MIAISGLTEILNIILSKNFFTEYDHRTQPKLTLPNQNYGRNVPNHTPSGPGRSWTSLEHQNNPMQTQPNLTQSNLR